MPDKKADTTIAHHVELSVGRLDSLSILPCVAARFLPQLLQGQFSSSALADIVKLDPAITAKVLSLISQQGVSISGGRFSLRQGIDKLGDSFIRDALVSLNVLRATGCGEIRKQLTLHSLAVACCAKDIAEITLPQEDSQLAFCAGLLHDIGKFALEEVMPKSFARIFEEAKSQRVGACEVERKYLGTDHTILGRRLARKWHLPDAVELAIWFHHSDTVTIYQNMPGARIAAIVQLANSMARQSGIGQSGSFDSPEEIEPTVSVLGMDVEQLKPIRQSLTRQVEDRAKVLGLDTPDAIARYADAAGTTVAKLAYENARLTDENRRLQAASSHLDFMTEFLLNANSAAGAIDIAQTFARCWQKYFQTGMVCLYLTPMADSLTLEAVVVENLSQSKTVLLNVPASASAIPQVIANKFGILNAQDYVDWLFEQLDIEFDLSRTRLVPLLSSGQATGAIVFELNWPGDIELFEDKIRTAASIAGTILGMARAGQRQERFAELFAQLVSKPKAAQSKIAGGLLTDAIAEMAAGAAHELNNPLLVISGRAQLLAKAETDKEKKQAIDQIKKNANQISQIIDDLMSFAEPPKPKPTQTDINQILDESIQLTSQKTKTEHINTQIEVADDVKSVFVDSAQVVSAIANIITNAIESYTDESGRVIITAESVKFGDFVKLIIRDSGCGMDTQTLQKATQPFFSAKAAGRKRGIGLAHAVRFIQINGGSMEIASEPGEGTTVTIYLPRG